MDQNQELRNQLLGNMLHWKYTNGHGSVNVSSRPTWLKVVHEIVLPWNYYSSICSNSNLLLNYQHFFSPQPPLFEPQASSNYALHINKENRSIDHYWLTKLKLLGHRIATPPALLNCYCEATCMFIVYFSESFSLLWQLSLLVMVSYGWTYRDSHYC